MDTNGIDFILHSGAFAAQRHDEHTYYSTDAKRVGVRLRGSVEHFEHIFVYGDVFYDFINHENLNQPKAFTKHREFGIELGAGLRFPVHLGHTGLILEGEFTTPFHLFDPALLASIKWERNRASIAFGNKIIARNASLLNLELNFEYKILPRIHKKKT